MSKKITDIKPQRTYPSSAPFCSPVRKTARNYYKISFIILMILLLNQLAGAPVVNYPLIGSEPILLAQVGEVQKLKASLEAQLQEVMKQIENYKTQISQLKKQQRSLKNELAILNAKIKKVQLEIRATQIAIRQLKQRIAETQKAIQQTKNKIQKSQVILGETLKVLYRVQQKSIVEILFSDQKLSDVFSEIVYINKLHQKLQANITELKELKGQFQVQEAKLEEEMAEQINLLQLAKIKQQQLQELQGEKRKLLAIARSKESEYQKLLKQSERTAAQIRAQIYRLAGGVGPITFGEAAKYAQLAEKLTGVRAALILAVLKYESNIGRNVGSCHYKKSMKPRERPLFEKIVRELGLDPNKMPVSCKPWYGWGGAMGPAQFIPSTWLRYKERVAALTGHNPPSPWNILDAFIAAALYLKDVGADKRTYQAEWRAVMKYFAGPNWYKPSLRFYGDDVMAIAKRFQRDLEILARG